MDDRSLQLVAQIAQQGATLDDVFRGLHAQRRFTIDDPRDAATPAVYRHEDIDLPEGAVVGGLASPVSADLSGPATPTGLNATNSLSSITLTWTQPTTGVRPTHFRVYEAGAVVARNTTTRVTVRNLAFGSSHTYQVTAVDSSGRESPPSAPITRSAFTGGPVACGITVPSGFTATEITASSVSLSWSNAIPFFDMPGTIVVLENSAIILQTTLSSARIGGLAPSSTHTYQVARRDCSGGLHASPPITVTTAAGDPQRPAPPTGTSVGARTNTSIALSWTAQPSADPTVAYTVYEGANAVTITPSTSTVLNGLWRDTAHEYRVAAVDAAGNESALSPPAQTSTLPCDTPLPAPIGVTARALSPSSVALSWTHIAQVTSFTVFRLPFGTAPVPVATVPGQSLMVTGLPSAATSRYAVVADTTGCGRSAASAPVTVTTPAGPAARPPRPADLRVVSSTPNFDFTGTVTLGWTQLSGNDPVVGYRLYQGTRLFATSPTTSVTLRLAGGPTHTISVAAVDPAGNESAQSALLAFTVPFIPPP